MDHGAKKLVAQSALIQTRSGPKKLADTYPLSPPSVHPTKMIVTDVMSSALATGNIEHDVARRDVAVNDPHLVEVADGTAEVTGHIPTF